MRRTKTSFSKYCLSLLALLCCSSAGFAATVNVVPSNMHPKVGDSFSVTVSGAGFPTVFGAQLGLTFNSAVVSVSGVVLAPGSPFTVGVTATLPFHSGDPINVVGPLVGVLPSGNFDAFQIKFKVLAAGNANITLVDNGIDRVWLDDVNKPIPVTYNQTHIQVNGPSRHRHTTSPTRSQPTRDPVGP